MHITSMWINSIYNIITRYDWESSTTHHKDTLYEIFIKLSFLIKSCLWFDTPRCPKTKSTVKNSRWLCDILPYSLWFYQVYYILGSPKILSQQTEEEGLYYRTKESSIMKLTSYLDPWYGVVKGYVRGFRGATFEFQL